MQDNDIMNVQEVAQQYKVSERTVRNWIEKEGLVAFPKSYNGK